MKKQRMLLPLAFIAGIAFAYAFSFITGFRAEFVKEVVATSPWIIVDINPMGAYTELGLRRYYEDVIIDQVHRIPPEKAYLYNLGDKLDLP